MPTNIIHITNTLTNIINLPAEVPNTILKVAEIPPRAWWEIALMIFGPALTTLSAWLMWSSVKEMRKQTKANQESAKNDKIFQLRYKHIKPLMRRAIEERFDLDETQKTLPPRVLRLKMHKISILLSNILPMQAELIGLFKGEKLEKIMCNYLSLQLKIHKLISPQNVHELDLPTHFFMEVASLFLAVCSGWDKFFLNISLDKIDDEDYQRYIGDLEDLSKKSKTLTKPPNESH